jgi:putative aminopeptidase FrvX
MAAGRAGIPFQQDAVHGLMSDARVVTALGIPSAVIGLPMRGKHAPLETVHLNDLTAALNLLHEALRLPLPTLNRG